MSLLQTNATISVLRATYNPATKQTSSQAVVLSNVPVYMQEIGQQLAARGMASEYPLRMLWDSSYDIRDGDRITGYNPANHAVPPILTVQHAATSGLGTALECRVAMLRGQLPAGAST